MARQSKSEKVPKSMKPTFDTIVALTNSFCEEHLNEEYAQLARQATAALCRKRRSPLTSGRANSWACGVVYALGFVNFLFDKPQGLYMSAADLCEGLGTSKSTGSAKSKVVRDTLNMMQLDPNWCLPSQLDENPLAWWIMVNGFIVDARTMSREIQEVAYQKRLIPYRPECP